MEFCDKIQEAVNCLRETQEYKQCIILKNKIKQDEELYAKYRELRLKIGSLQSEYINGRISNEEMEKQLYPEYSELTKNETARKFFEMEHTIDVMITEMQRILAEGMKELVEL